MAAAKVKKHPHAGHAEQHAHELTPALLAFNLHHHATTKPEAA